MGDLNLNLAVSTSNTTALRRMTRWCGELISGQRQQVKHKLQTILTSDAKESKEKVYKTYELSIFQRKKFKKPNRDCIT